MGDLVTLTINGRSVQAAPGTLVIDAAKRNGIEIPAFCYYEGYSLQAACRMCLVEVEKMPKLQAACTLPVAEGMVVRTESEQVQKARKTTLEFLLTNHPLDCPVCDKGGECELQDMVFRYGAGESRFTENKHHVDEKQWSPVVFYDGPRCILCYRCVRVCDEGMGVGALGVVNRGVLSEIAPSHGDHLECDECGNCIDICPVGALTSGTYRYQTRPWEMKHVGTICTFCGDGCKTTLAVRDGKVMRGNNRDRSGINGEFLCMKGRYGFDFLDHPDRLTAPMLRQGGELKPIAWSQALSTAAAKFAEVKAKGGKIAVIGSTKTTNEEAFYLQKFARQGLATSHIDHHRTGDLVTLVDALNGRTGALATMQDLYLSPAALIVGADLSQEHPFAAFQLRANWRHHKANVYAVTSGPVREDNYASATRVAAGKEMDGVIPLRDQLSKEKSLVILYGGSVKGDTVRQLVAFGDTLGIPVKYVCLLEYANSRGAIDMGLLPDLGPGYKPVAQPGLTLPEMLADPDIDLFYIIGANPFQRTEPASKKAYVIVQDLFVTETANRADLVLAAASAYEKSGSFTNTTGEVQRLHAAARTMGVKTDLEIIGLIAKEMKINLGIWSPANVFEEIRQSVSGYNIPLPVIATGQAAQTSPLNGRIPVASRPELIQPAGNTLFTSGSLGRYSKKLTSVVEHPGQLYRS